MQVYKTLFSEKRQVVFIRAGAFIRINMVGHVLQPLPTVKPYQQEHQFSLTLII